LFVGDKKHVNYAFCQGSDFPSIRVPERCRGGLFGRILVNYGGIYSRILRYEKSLSCVTCKNLVSNFIY